MRAGAAADSGNAELEKLEDLRSEQFVVAANERNVIASTREKAAGGVWAAARTRRDTTARMPWTASPPARSRSYAFDREGRRGVFSHSQGMGGGEVVDRGLDDRHYADVNRRQQACHKYLVERERKLQSRLRRVASDQTRNIRHYDSGTDSQIRSLSGKAEALYTYLAAPVSPSHEIQSVLAMC